ncbi:oligosaccharide flippase family protein, partial [Macellibacteroides fermentans]|uniref:oligosaccharide flippase family protein n=1 Tax=Macellibacteroides fermentans TaxID=879969 RepID=UPI00406CA678
MKLNVIFSILGVALTTLFPIIVFPYISRTLGVDEMGKYNYYNSIITYLSFLSNFGISIYGVREIGKYRNNLKLKNKKAAELIYLNIITTIVCYLLIIPW